MLSSKPIHMFTVTKDEDDQFKLMLLYSNEFTYNEALNKVNEKLQNSYPDEDRDVWFIDHIYGWINVKD